ncbi:MAG: 4Fe-4S binding protein [Thermoplasmatales archaeon]|nr:MAG: 4Fe-4S binding protein [Thermoplasmatales archaeon]
MKLQKRLISQLFFFFFANLGFRINNWFNGKTGFCYPFFYCHSCPTATSACPIRAVEEGLFRGFENKVNFKLLFYPFFIVGFVGIITGRAVCGWVCPIGFLQRGTAKVARKFKDYSLIKRLESHKMESFLRYVKYFIFVGLVILTAYFVGFMFTNICPVGFLTGTIPISIINPGKYVPNQFFYTALIIFILFLVLIFTIERGWCRYFCPVGAMFAPFNKISMLSISVDKDECIHCNVCSNICPMNIDVPNMNRDPECIFCGKCMEICPKKIVKFERSWEQNE